MLDHVHILTLTHRTAKLKVVGELVATFEAEGLLEERLRGLLTGGIMDEVYYLSTCNRVLLLFTTRRKVDDGYRAELTEQLGDARILEMRHLYGQGAIRHLYEVAASIDSMVIGERQILGQLRESYERCRKWSLIGDDLRIVFDQAVLAAKDVYANTRIGEKSVSIVSLAIQELNRHGLSLDSRILMIGAGQTNMLVAKFLKKQGFSRVVVANRNVDRAHQVAASFGKGEGFALSELPAYEKGFDVLFICTGASEAILTPALYERLVAGEEDQRKVVVDLGVPADVDEATVNAFSFEYIGIEALKGLANRNMDFRRQEIARADEVLVTHLETVDRLYRQRLLERAMSELPAEIKAVRHTAVNQIFRKEVEGLDPETRELMDRMLQYMEKRCIGIPMKVAREAILG